jgi:hypothetical protein
MNKGRVIYWAVLLVLCAILFVLYTRIKGG